MKPTEQYVPVMLFIMLYKVVLPFETVNENEFNVNVAAQPVLSRLRHASYLPVLLCLIGLSLRSLRSRFAFLKSLNLDVERLLLPVTDLRAADSYNLSIAALLREARGLLFYHTKVALLNHVLNHTAHRRAEDSPPEVSLDPLEALEGSFTVTNI